MGVCVEKHYTGHDYFCTPKFYLFVHCLLVSGETSSSKQEEVKRLPGGKIKKKVRTCLCVLEAFHSLIALHSRLAKRM